MEKHFFKRLLIKLVRLLIAIAVFDCILFVSFVFSNNYAFGILNVWLIAFFFILVEWIAYITLKGRNCYINTISTLVSLVIFTISFLLAGGFELWIWKINFIATILSVLYAIITTFLVYRNKEKINPEVVVVDIPEEIKGSELTLKLFEEEWFLDKINGCQRFEYRIFLKETKTCIGKIDIRIPDSRKSYLYFGHVGYVIKKKYRGKGWAFKALTVLLPEVKKLGIKEILITCDINNLASVKTIEHLKYKNKRYEKTPIIYRLMLQRKKFCRYQIDLSDYEKEQVRQKER